MTNQVPTSTWRAFRVTLLVIYFCMLGGLLVFLGLAAYLLHFGEMHSSPELGRKMLHVVLPLFVACIALGSFVPRMMLRKVRPAMPLGERLIRYRTALITRLAFFEAAGLGTVMALLASQELYFLYVVAVSLLLLLFSMPTLERVASALKLPQEDAMALSRNEPFEVVGWWVEEDVELDHKQP